MYIDDCEDCKIFCGPIDGSVFIRGSKNCEFSIIARQVRFRNCENLKVFTYCPSCYHNLKKVDSEKTVDFFKLMKEQLS